MKHSTVWLSASTHVQDTCHPAPVCRTAGAAHTSHLCAGHMYRARTATGTGSTKVHTSTGAAHAQVDYTPDNCSRWLMVMSWHRHSCNKGACQHSCSRWLTVTS